MKMSITLINWRTRQLDKIEEIDYEGPKVYMFTLNIEGNYILLYVGMTKQSLKSRVLERSGLASEIANLAGYNFLISCSHIKKTDKEDRIQLVDKIENLLIKEMQPQLNKVSGIVLYEELTSDGDIPFIHNWRMFWRECKVKTNDEFWRKKAKAREFICEGEYFD